MTSSVTLSESISEQTKRVIFLDKIRYTMVLGVVILHAACAYATIIPWWCVLDSNRKQIFDLLIVILDIYQMPILYFLSGYFAVASLNRHGFKGYVLGKLKRLGMPLLVVGLFFVPIMPYIRHCLSDEAPVGFFQYWWMQMTTVLDWRWVHITSPDIGARIANHFSQWHLWFISLLLIFCLLSALWFKFFPNQMKQNMRTRSNNTRSILFSLLCVLLFGAGGMVLMQRVSPGWAWAKMGGLILVQPSRLPIYAGFFILGLYAYSRNWFSRASFPGSPWIWLALSGISAFFLLGALKAIGYHPAPIPWGHAIFHGGARVISALAFLCFFLSAGQIWGQRPTAMWRQMHPVSYDIYLIHLPLMIIFQLGALYMPIPLAAKFLLVSVVTMVTSWSIGKFIIKPKPVLAVAMLIVGFGITSAVIY